MSGRRSDEAGFVLAALLAMISIMLIGLGAAAPTWRYVMKDSREQELIFRGDQIAEAIERYQRKHGNAPPTSLDTLVKGRFLRKLYTDPMTPDGKWRLIHMGEILPHAGGSTGTPPATRPSRPQRGQTLGGILGVASKSTEQGLRVFNGKTHYNEWLFVAGQPRVVGRQPGPVRIPGARPRLGASPTPLSR